jgi:aminopeptidase N
MKHTVAAARILPFLLLTSCSAEPDRVPYAERTIQVAPVAYDLAIEVDYQEPKIRGTGQLTVRNTSDHSADHIPLLLYRMMKVTNLTDVDGNPLRFTEQIVPFEDWDKLQVNYVQVETPSFDAGEETTISITWQGYLYGYTEAMRYVQDHIDPVYTTLREETKSYPVVGYPSWQAFTLAGMPDFDVELRVTVPDTLIVAHGGELMGVEREDGKATYHYRSVKPSWRIDIAIAPYEIMEREGLKLFYFPEDGARAQTIAGGFLRAMDQYTEWFGPLHDFGGYAIIEVPTGYGSQAAVSNMMLQAAAFQDPDQLTQLYHEASHLWNVELTERPSPRWDEGLAMFLQQLLLDVFAGDQDLSAVEGLAGRLRERLKTQFENEPRLGEIPPIEYGNEDVTDLSYRVDMLMFGVLYHLIGQEGLNSLVGGFYQEHHDAAASTDDFVARAKEIAPVNLDRFFEDWLYGTGYTRFLDSDVTLAQIADTYR